MLFCSLLLVYASYAGRYFKDRRVVIALSNRDGWRGYLNKQVQFVSMRLADSQLGVDTMDVVIMASYPVLVVLAMRWFKWRHHTRYRSMRLFLISCVLGPVTFLVAPDYLWNIWFNGVCYLLLLLIVRLEVQLQTKKRAHSKVSARDFTGGGDDVWFGRADDGDKTM